MNESHMLARLSRIGEGKVWKEMKDISTLVEVPINSSTLNSLSGMEVEVETDREQP
jgi:hypothetical protein